MKKKTSKGMTFATTAAKAEAKKAYLQNIGYTSVRIRKLTPKSSRADAVVYKMGDRYELTYTIHW